ncbi:hypothetical protein [Corynebacterium comes]|uniref:Alpha helical Porin B n=1 Tax=Corynebacterium comes TaxID=2675218 RepID=A0A6B8VYI4_9CORY|nr:hypothetical protein [Corynebacterium comes]QGU04105.1 Alpha helical Porin B [Corynebacterium comes]
MIRRTLATVAVTAIAVVGLAPAASAQLGAIDKAIADAPCSLVDPALKAAFRIDGNTTRSDLAKQIRDEARPLTITDPATYLISAQYAGQIADKAVECGTVKKDPELFPGSSIPGLGNISNINEVQDILTDLSSTLASRQ